MATRPGGRAERHVRRRRARDIGRRVPQFHDGHPVRLLGVAAGNDALVHEARVTVPLGVSFEAPGLSKIEEIRRSSTVWTSSCASKTGSTEATSPRFAALDPNVEWTDAEHVTFGPAPRSKVPMPTTRERQRQTPSRAGQVGDRRGWLYRTGVALTAA